MLGRVYFAGNDSYQNFLVFAPKFSYLILDSNNKIDWILTRISSEKIKPFDTNFEPTLSNLAKSKIILKFSNSVLVQKKFSSLDSNFNLKLYIVYELATWPRNPTNNFTLKNFLFGTVQLTRNPDKSKVTYNGWGIAFDRKVFSSFDNDIAKNVTVFCVKNSSSPHNDNPKK